MAVAVPEYRRAAFGTAERFHLRANPGELRTHRRRDRRLGDAGELCICAGGTCRSLRRVGHGIERRQQTQGFQSALSAYAGPRPFMCPILPEVHGNINSGLVNKHSNEHRRFREATNRLARSSAAEISTCSRCKTALSFISSTVEGNATTGVRNTNPCPARATRRSRTAAQSTSPPVLAPAYLILPTSTAYGSRMSVHDFEVWQTNGQSMWA